MASSNPDQAAIDAAVNQYLSSGGAGSPGLPPGYGPSGGTAAGGATGQTSGVSGAPQGATISVGSYKITLDASVQPNAQVSLGGMVDYTQQQRVPGTPSNRYLQAQPGMTRAVPAKAPVTMGVSDAIQTFNSWSSTQYDKFKQDAINMGLFSTKSPSKQDVLNAWTLVVENSALMGSPGSPMTTDALIKKAIQSGGLDNINPKLTASTAGLSGSTTGSQSGTQSETRYVSYIDPATAQGLFFDSMYRLVGRAPSTKEYQAFLNGLYSYQNTENSGKFTTSEKDVSKGGAVPGPTSGAPGTATTPGTTTNSVTNTVSQEGVGARGVEYLAANAAMNQPEYGAYQAETTYFNALVKALGGPAAGMTGSGPTTITP